MTYTHAINQINAKDDFREAHYVEVFDEWFTRSEYVSHLVSPCRRTGLISGRLTPGPAWRVSA
jgi:hypothetical protein